MDLKEWRRKGPTTNGRWSLAASSMGEWEFFGEQTISFWKKNSKKSDYIRLVLKKFQKVWFFRKLSEIEILPLGAGHVRLIIQLRSQQTWFRNFFLEGTCSTHVSWRFYNSGSRGHSAIIVVLQVITRRLNGWLRAARYQAQSPWNGQPRAMPRREWSSDSSCDSDGSGTSGGKVM